MAAVEATDAVVELVADGMFGELIERAADEVAEGVAAEDVAGDEDRVAGEDQASEADAEVAVKPEAFDGVDDEEEPDDVGEAQEIAVEVLGDEGKFLFAAVGWTCRTNSRSLPSAAASISFASQPAFHRRRPRAPCSP